MMKVTNVNCIDNSYENSLIPIKNTTVDTETRGVGIRQWMWQTCTQFGYCKYMCTQFAWLMLVYVYFC